MFPLHIWLPSAHANAPSHVSAMLSGVALKMGIYGIVRFSGWLPVPRTPLPFRSIVAASSNDPLGDHDRIAELAEAWGSERVDLGAVGHLNPASGYGEWPRAEAFIDELAAARQRA